MNGSDARTDHSGEETDSQPSDLDDALSSPRKGKGRGHTDGQTNIIVQTDFDAYFTQSASRSQTSSNVFSALVPPLSAEEYSEAIRSISTGPKPIQPRSSSSSCASLFRQLLLEMFEGFNLLLYGFGSKRRLLNQFASEHCTRAGFVVVANGFQPSFTLKDLLSSIEKVPGITDSELSSTTIENQVKRIYEFFSLPNQTSHLFIIIHNIDAPAFRAPKSKLAIASLALSSRIHIAASIDHINAPLLWSSSEQSTRKPGSYKVGDTHARGFAWLWHDLTTLAPYDFELAWVDRSSLTDAHGGSTRKKTDGMAAQNATAMSETAALHILASVTQKAQKLFVLMGTRQLQSADDVGSATDMQQHAIAYDTLFNAARDNFIATNDTALRSLLGEFRDHGLVIAAPAGGGGGEVLWIPLHKEKLTRLLGHLKAEV
ncbi:origin recognition complex subunit 2 [Infundibulicybe gibba]|nr:origin recognition complex subunit 2 [Infundibulicybe gibba]